MRSAREIDVTRWVGVALLAAGLAVAHSSFPTRPVEDFQPIHAFELDGEECSALRQERDTTELRIPPEAEEPVTIAAVAEKFHLELALVCRANGHPADCGEIQLAPGEDTLVLPLGRDWPGAVTAETP